VDPIALFIIVLTGALCWMALLFAIQTRTGDAGIVDFGWTAGLGFAALFYGIVAEGDFAFRLGLVLVACPWSFRLAAYILRDRVMGREEDGRYQMLREGWGSAAPIRFALFFAFQALLVGLFSLIFLVVATRTGPFGWVNYMGIALGWLAIGGEGLADRQLSRWRLAPENKGKTCREGLWRYSRHPNYFFEWLHWWAYVLLAMGSNLAWLTLAGPLLMLLFLYRVTGIPYTEKQALKSRGDDYRRYQASTSPFFPWFPKNEHPL